MADRTHIEWTDASWNPVTGCTEVSPGCDNCYARGIAERFRGTKPYPNGFEVTLHPDRIAQPLRWRRPRMIFVNSMSDLFHRDIPREYIARVFAVMACAPQHTFQILTKRPGVMRSLLNNSEFHWLYVVQLDDLARQGIVTEGATAAAVLLHNAPLPNVWLGVSAESQPWAEVRIPALLETPAAVRFLSAEPLLGELHLHGWLEESPRLDWVIVGGESGTKARPMHPDWARMIRNECLDAGVAFHFKQWGEWWPGFDARGRWFHHWGALDVSTRLGKRAAGRQLDGRTWDEYPEPTTTKGATHT